MSARFRIRTTQGQEISFASNEMFEEFVRGGDLDGDDVVYDAETREWAPARTHPIVLQIELDAERAKSTQEVGAPGDPRIGGDEVPAADLGLELAPAQEQPTPEEAAAAFVKKMEAERQSERPFEADSGLGRIRMEQGGSGLIDGIMDVPAPPKKPARPQPEAPRPAPTRRASTRRPEPKSEAAKGPPGKPTPSARPTTPSMPPQPRKPDRAPQRTSASTAPKPKKSGSGKGAKVALFLVLGVAAGAAGVYFAPSVLSPSLDAPGPGSPVETAPQPSPEPTPALIPDTEEAVLERAHELYLAETQRILRVLEPIPDVWLQGRYLAAPSDYTEVRDAWSVYLTLVREVRAGDEDLYRTSYERALDDARIAEPARGPRLATAMTAFQADAPDREAHFQRVERLAAAAIQGHDVLLEAEGTIAYEPATGPTVSGDPVIEAVGRSAEAQSLLDDVLDGVLAEVQAEGGPGQMSGIRAWVYEGLLDAVAN